jgi:hypothetical protein
MKNIFILTILFSISSCATTKVKSINEKQNLKINNVKIDTINIDNFNKLQLVNIKSALDSQKLMYLEFGMWNESRIGLYQKNISQKIWKNIDLFKNGKTYTIIADGTETLEDYFSTIIIYDSDNIDCLNPDYPLRVEIIAFFQSKMKTIESKNFNYNILRKKNNSNYLQNEKSNFPRFV